jgi:ATP-binding protein involved in chromosome partitioning
VRVISVGMLVGTEEAVIWRGPLLHKTLTTFITQVAWGELDYLFVDLPPGTGDVPLTIAQELPGARMIVVTTPQDAAVEVAARAARMAETVNMDVAGVIENMSFYRPDPESPPVYVFGQGGGRRLARLIDAPLLAEIPLDPLVRESGDRGEPVVLGAPCSPASRAFLAAAEQLLRIGESAPVPS